MVFLPVVLLLVACSNVPEPDNILPSLEPTDLAVSTTQVKQTPVLTSPTPLPVAEFEGITLTYNETLLGALQETAHKTAQAPGTGMAQPEHISFSFNGSDLLHEVKVRVYPLPQYEKMSTTAATHIADLKDILNSKPVQLPTSMPLFPWVDTISAFETAPVYIDFVNGRGLSFVALANYGSQEEPVYVFQGISHDHEHLITALAPLTIDTLVTADSSSADTRLAQIANRSFKTLQELEAIQHELDASFQSLEIDRANLFSDLSLDSYLSYPGLLLTYDPQVSGNATIVKTPPVYTLPDGESVFLSGVPDAILVNFDGHKTHDQAPKMIIQPVRGAAGQFYSSVPAHQIKQVELLEESEGIVIDEHTEDLGKPQRIAFQTGMGERVIRGQTKNNHDIGQDPTYEFRGITSDGRYFVSFSHPLELHGEGSMPLTQIEAASSSILENQVELLDLMIQSLVINADVSTGSSMPVNEPGCKLDAEFVRDLTIPDHSLLERGHAATKIWHIRNTGTCTWTPAYQIQLAGGNPIAWQKPSVIEIVQPGEETEISVEIVSPENPGIYQAWWQLTDESGNNFGPFYHVIFESPPPATDVPGHGVIEGKIGYPASKIPAMIIYFLRIDGSERYALETESGWDHYANELPAGDYFVFARVAGDESNSGGGFTAAVKCDMTCDDHELLVVTVEESKATRNVNILDWYAPVGTFPLP